MEVGPSSQSSPLDNCPGIKGAISSVRFYTHSRGNSNIQTPTEEGCLQVIVPGDEWANSLTHGLGLVLSVIGLILLLIIPFQEQDHWKLMNLGIYGASLIFLYAASTCYHILRKPKLKILFRTIDHCAIYVLIAGSYTPFTMLVLQGVWGWALFIIVWTLAIIGIVLKVFFKNRFQVFSTVLYLFMGWLVVVAAEPLMQQFHIDGLVWLFFGGLSYTIGVIFYVFDRKKFFHAIWHLFVLTGSTCHYFAVWLYL